jgi:hypothetical protein
VFEDAPFRVPDPDAVGDERNSLMDTFALLRELIPQMQAAGTSLADATAMMAASPGAAGGTLGELLHEDGLETLSAGLLDVDASVLDPVLTGIRTPVFDPDQPLAMAIAAVAADPASPDAVTQPGDLIQLAATSPHVSTHTLAGANHLIHDTVGQREPFWTIVDEFLGSLSD